MPDQKELAAVASSQPSVAKNPRQVLNDYLNDPKVDKNLHTWADYLNKRFHGNWFKLSQMIKKSPLKVPQQAADVLNMLVLKGLAHREERQGDIKFKITLEVESKIKLLQQQIDVLNEQIRVIQTEIDRLRPTDGVSDKL